MFTKRTSYSVIDEYKKRSTITINKFDADILQLMEKDVHLLVQKTYDKVTVINPKLSRLKRGDVVRMIMSRRAASHPIYKIKIDKIL